MLSIITPVCLTTCSKDGYPPVAEPEHETQIYIQKIEKATSGALDVFFFNDDALMRLDSYQRIPLSPGNLIKGASGSGNKIAAAVMNLPGDIWSWSDICSFQGLSGRKSSIMAENPASPVSTAVLRTVAGKPCRMDLTPLLASIKVNSICCDFSMRPYRGARLEDVNIYLINVNAECSLFPEDALKPSSWINLSMNDPSQTSAMEHPEMVFTHIGESIGEETVFPSVTLSCYPNGNGSDGFGSPLTRLVIEGNLLGTTYYYPISLPMLRKGEVRVFDISITRTGTTDPDLPADIWTSGSGIGPKPWDGHGNIVIEF